MKTNRKTITMLVLLLLTSLPAIAQQHTQLEKQYLYLYVDKLPTFKGGTAGMKSFLRQNLKWPDNSSDVQGTVLLSFIVSAEGYVKNVKVEKSLSETFDKEAKRIIELMPKWTPGKLKNNNVDVKLYIPIDFIIKD